MFPLHGLLNTFSPTAGPLLWTPGHGHNKGTLHAVELLFSGCSCTADADTERAKKDEANKKSHSLHSRKRTGKGFFRWCSHFCMTRNFGCRQVWWKIGTLKGRKGEKEQQARSLAPSQRPVQTKSWTSEPGGSKLKVWLPVGPTLLEVTSGKCSCLRHFTVYGHLTSDLLTGFLQHPDTQYEVLFLF